MANFETTVMYTLYDKMKSKLTEGKLEHKFHFRVP